MRNSTWCTKLARNATTHFVCQKARVPPKMSYYCHPVASFCTFVHYYFVKKHILIIRYKTYTRYDTETI